MKREYTIVIEAKGAHQPSNDEIFKAILKLVDNRAWEFPKRARSTHVTIIPKRF